MNSRAKGARGERQWRDELRASGYAARRGQQFRGSPDSPDVVCEALGWAHFEVKSVARLNIEDAMEQARRDGGGKVPLVAHKRNHRRWLVTMDAETFFKFLRGDFARSTSPRPSPLSGEGDGAHGVTRPTQKLSAAACAVAVSENNKSTTEQTKQKV